MALLILPYFNNIYRLGWLTSIIFVDLWTSEMYQITRFHMSVASSVTSCDALCNSYSLLRWSLGASLSLSSSPSVFSSPLYPPLFLSLCFMVVVASPCVVCRRRAVVRLLGGEARSAKRVHAARAPQAFTYMKSKIIDLIIKSLNH